MHVKTIFPFLAIFFFTNHVTNLFGTSNIKEVLSDSSSFLKHYNNGACSLCQKILSECHPLLQEWFEYEQAYDPTVHITEGYRGPVKQESAFTSGASKAHWGYSAHNYLPCLAVDVFFIIDGKHQRPVPKYKELIKRMPPFIENGSIFPGLVDWGHFQLKYWKLLTPTFPYGNPKTND